MKKLLLVLPLAALLIQACSNDFELTAPWKEVPVVYAILSPQDTANYIRIEKAFLDPETSALQIAQIADSLYYSPNAIDAYLEEISSNKRFQITRVDGNLEGHPRQGGIFATQPNWLYKTKEKLQPGQRYRLRIIRSDGRPDVTAETTIPANFFVQTPNQLDLPVKLTFLRDKSATVLWFTDVNGVYFRVNFRIRYRENALNGTLIKRDTLYWTPITNVKRTDVQTSGFYIGTETISSESFYRFLVENLAPTSTTFRRFEGIDLTLEGGGKEIEEYLETANANAGITGAELITTYTNISEGFGIFTAKNTITVPNILITPQTINSMNERSPERDLNFQ